ncbi:hypothetical protein ZWY2020_023591 [Hordeum vulgare]|nr:hypothetical protein ZWY2020_023591 [Hordeum vulgare]
MMLPSNLVKGTNQILTKVSRSSVIHHGDHDQHRRGDLRRRSSLSTGVMRRFPAPAVKAAGKLELRQNVPAVMTVNDFQQRKGDGGEALCDDEFVVSLSPEWYAGRARCGRTIHIPPTST